MVDSLQFGIVTTFVMEPMLLSECIPIGYSIYLISKHNHVTHTVVEVE